MMSRDVDAAWLTASLVGVRSSSVAVTGFDASSIGTGQVGENVRFVLTWNDDDPGLPLSVVGKFPSTSAVSRAAAIRMNTYVKEIGFYRHLQDVVSIRTPHVHAIEWDADTHDFAVLMEDIRPARAGDQIRGCTVAEAALAVDQAVGLHAPTWGRTDEWADHAWLAATSADEQVTVRSQLFRLLTPGFVERFAGRLADDDIAIAEPLVAAFGPWYAAVREWAADHGAWCVVHGDFRVDNLLFGDPPTSPPITVVDWQTVAVGIGPSDIAYFCGAGLLPDPRAEAERGLVERYAAGLRRAGVEISDAAVWDGYVLGSVTGYYMAVLASQVVEQTERGDEMFAVMAERHAAQMRSVGLLDRLGIG